MTEGQKAELWFARLIPLLAVQKLPCENGPARHCDVGEFMFMGEVNNGSGSFKHCCTRNYIVVRRNTSSEPFKTPGEWELQVPCSMVPFNRGFFDTF
jgi:hypothetical protein